MRDAVICEPLRTPVGRYGGVFRDVPAADLAAAVIRELVARTGVTPEDIDDVLLGQCYPNGEAPGIGRVAALDADLPISVTGYQLDRRCGSGLQTIINAAMQVQTGASEIVLAGGVESMSQSEFYTTAMRWGAGSENVVMYDRLARGRVTSGGVNYPVPGGMLETAENLRREYQIPRQEQDEFSLRSHQRAVAAQEKGVFDEEIVPITVHGRKGDTVVSADEHPRPDTTLESLAKLRPVMLRSDADSTVTAGNFERPERRRLGVPRHLPRKGRRTRVATSGPPAVVGRRRRRARADGHRARAGHRQGARAGGPLTGRHPLDRAQRGIRLPGAGLHPRVGFQGRRLRPPQRARIGYLARPPGGRDGRTHSGHSAARDGPTGSHPGSRDHVHRRRSGSHRDLRSRRLDGRRRDGHPSTASPMTWRAMITCWIWLVPS